MRVEEIMSKPVSVTKRTVKVTHLKDLFSRKGVNAVPVLETGGAIAGIVSASDVAKCHDENLTVNDIMSEHVHIALKNTRVKDAAGVMVKHRVHHLIVMEDGDVVGMLSSLDVMKVFAEV